MPDVVEQSDYSIRLFMLSHPTDQLHELIRSLTPSEKRYFKLQNKTEAGTKSYLQLFDAIEQLEAYDELAVRDALKGQKLLNQLHVAKNYLYKQVLRSLRSFHAGSDSISSPFLSLTEHLGDMKILQSKGLFDQSKKAFRKAESIAEEYDDDLFRLVIATYEDDRVAEPVDRKGKASARFDRRVHLLDRLRTSYALKLSLEELYDTIALKGSAIPHDDDPLSSVMIEELPFGSQIDHCSYRCYDHFSRHEHAEAARWAKHALDLFDQHPHQRDQSTETYLSFLSNYFTCLQNDDYASMPQMRDALIFANAIQAFDRVNARTAVQRSRVWATRILAEFEWGLLTSNDAKLLDLLKTFEKEFNSKRKLLSRLEHAWFYFTVAKAHFWTGDLGKSLTWLNRLLDDPEFKHYEEYYAQALIFSLILHFELGNSEYLKGALGSVKRFIESRDLSQSLAPLLDQLERLLRGDNSADSLAEFSELVDGEGLETETHGSVRFFEFNRWLNKRMLKKKNADFVEV